MSCQRHCVYGVYGTRCWSSLARDIGFMEIMGHSIGQILGCWYTKTPRDCRSILDFDQWHLHILMLGILNAKFLMCYYTHDFETIVTKFCQMTLRHSGMNSQIL